MIRIRRTLNSYRAAMRISPRTRRRARPGEVTARGTEWRYGVYSRQNGTPEAHGLMALTPRQRRRVLHKENAGRGR